MKHQCWFTASKPDTELVGGVHPAAAPKDDNPLCEVAVLGNTSTNTFELSNGDYRYVFNITSGGKFTLKLFVDGVQTDISPAKFDPDDPELGDLARTARRTLFTIS